VPLPERVDPGDVRQWWADHRSPFAALLNLTLDEVGDGLAVMRLPYAPAMRNEVGSVHGGAIASLCDSAMYVAMLSALGTAAQLVTVNLTVAFLAAPAPDSDLIASARTVKTGRTISFGEVSVEAGARTVAHATLNYVNADRR
jgi:uncharacterized protein (TIGR00369 family)